MLEMVIPLEVVVQISHTHREVLVCELVNHLGSNSVAGVLARAPFRAHPGNKALRQVGQDWFQTGVLIHSWQCLRCHLFPV